MVLLLYYPPWVLGEEKFSLEMSSSEILHRLTNHLRVKSLGVGGSCHAQCDLSSKLYGYCLKSL